MGLNVLRLSYLNQTLALNLLPMKIAVSGKGGSGKTSIAGTLARLVARAGRDVVAIDADVNPNLALTLGLHQERFDELPAMPHRLLQHLTVNGETTLKLIKPFDEVVSEHGVDCPDQVRLLLMGQPLAGTG
jgi:CO dehydrogenase maturation factor